MTDIEIARYFVSRVWQVSLLIEGYFTKQGIRYNVGNYNGPDASGWIGSGAKIFRTGRGDFIVSGRGHLARLKYNDPEDIVRWIWDDMRLHAVLSEKKDIIAYGDGTPYELIREILNICNSALLPEEAAELRRREEQEKREQEEKEEKTKKEAKEKVEINQIIVDYEDRLRRNPNDAEVYKDRGFIFMGKGYLEQAIIDFTKSLQLNPNNVKAYNYRGLANAQKNEPDKAISDYNYALKLTPDDATIFAMRGMAYSKKNEFDKAMADFNEALRLDPKCEQAYMGKGALYIEKSEFDMAIANYEDALQLESNDTLASILVATKKLKYEAEQNERQRIENEERECREKAKGRHHKIGRVAAPLLQAIAVIVAFNSVAVAFFGVAIMIASFSVLYFSEAKGKKRIVFLVLGIFFTILVTGGRNDFVFIALTSYIMAFIFPKRS